MADSLDELFNASSVAVLGASNNPRKASHQVIRTLLQEGYTGRSHPVNPAESEVLGLKCHPSLSSIREKVDLLVISVPARAVPDIMRQAVSRGDIRGAVILSAGFSETAIPEMVGLEQEIVQLARTAHIRVIGPNCLGLINSANRLSTGFAPGLKIKPGSVGFITQSGALGAAFLMLAADQPIPLGFSKFGHVGNMCDVTNLELLQLYGDDDSITTIAMYIEAVRDGREFLRILREITPRKPVFVLKVGRTGAGSHAALSHTGSLAGSDGIYDAALRQGGAVRLGTLEELLDASKAAAMLPAPAGGRVCVLTEAGGPGIIALDEIGQAAVLELAPLSPTTRQAMESVLPFMASVCKPGGYIDMTAAAMEEEHAAALRLALEDENVDAVILISVPPTFLPAIDVARRLVDVVEAQPRRKPVLVCFMKGEVMREARRYLENHGIPTFDTPERAVRALANFVRAVQR